MVAVLTGKSSDVISTKDGVVSLDLSGIANEVVSQLKSRGVDLFDSVNIPQGRFTIEIFQSDAITKAQVAFSAFNTVAIVLPFLTILLFVGGIFLFPNRRRGALWAAVALSLGMAVLLLALAIGRTIYLGAIPSSVMPQGVAATFFDTLVRFLRQSARALLAVGIIGSARVRDLRARVPAPAASAIGWPACSGASVTRHPTAWTSDRSAAGSAATSWRFASASACWRPSC